MSNLARTVATARAYLREAIESEAVVTIVLDNGRAHTGIVREHGTLADGYYVLQELGTRRPHAFHRSELEEVIFE